MKKLNNLREESVLRKLFSIRKLIQRATKKARQASVQKLIRKVQKIKSSEMALVSEEKVNKILEDVRMIKSLDLTNATSFILVKHTVQYSSLTLMKHFENHFTSFEKNIFLYLNSKNLDEFPKNKVVSDAKDHSGLNIVGSNVSPNIEETNDSSLKKHDSEDLIDSFQKIELQKLECLVLQLVNKTLDAEILKILKEFESFLRITFRESVIEPSEIDDFQPNNPDLDIEKPNLSLQNVKYNHASKKLDRNQSFCHRLESKQQSNARETLKNRKGQRARRAEWERVYGGNAKHLVTSNLNLNNKSADSGHQLNLDRKYMSSNFDDQKKSFNFDRRHSKITSENISSANYQRGQKSMRPHELSKTQQKLHPSWEAQKRQRELQNLASGMQTVNKRIKFD